MDEAQIKFGDKVFIYGIMTDWVCGEEHGLVNPTYNSIMGYIPVGGYFATPLKSDQVDACLPGFVMDATDSLAVRTLFSRMEMVDVTSLLSRQEPSLSGTKVWMPTPH